MPDNAVALGEEANADQMLGHAPQANRVGDR
jgi:hypothetical protein